MNERNTVVLLVIAVAVHLSNGFSIKTPGAVTASFSGSSSSSAAFSHSSASSSAGSYSFNGPINPEDLEKLKASGAVANAAAGAGAFGGAGGGSISHAGAGSFAGSSSGAVAGSGSIAGGSGEHFGGADAGSGAIGSANLGPNVGVGCSEGSSGCDGNQDSNAIGGLPAPENTGNYKIINTDKYNTGYSSGSKGPNYAVAGQYVQGSQTATGGCATCKGPFPGPNGSIHDYKPASSIPAGSASHVQPLHPSGNTAHAQAAAGSNSGSGAYYQPSQSISNLPVAPGNIYTSKPAVGVSAFPPASSNSGIGSGSGHVSPSLIATFPGPTGSIYDSKPAGAVAGAGASTGTASHSGSGSVSNIPALHPVVGPTCSYTPGSPNKNCGGTTFDSGTASGQTIVPVLPGSSGNVYDTKPASHGVGAGAGAAAGTGSYSNSGSVSNNPSSHPVVTSACSYTPGSPNYCGGTSSASEHKVTPGSSSSVIPILPGSSGSIYNSKPVPSVPSHAGAGSGAHSSSGAGASAGSYSDSGSVSNIPSSHPVDKPICNYTPGSPNYCGGTSSATEHKITPGSSTGIVPILPGPSGSIYTSKPASSVPSHVGAGSGAHSGSGAVASAGANAGSYSDSGSVTNIPSSNTHVEHKVTPGSSVSVIPILPGPSGSIYSSKPASSVPSHAGSGAGAHSGSGAVASAGASAGSNTYVEHKVSPGSSASVIPILPGPSGSIYSSKPASSVPYNAGAGSGVHSGSAAGTGFGSGSGSYSGSGSVSNVASSYPVVGPACNYTPGSPNKCGSGSVPQTGISGAGANAGAGAVAQAAGGVGFGSGSGSYSGSGSVSNVPSSHPVVGPACSYTPGSPNKCGNGNTPYSGAGANAGAIAGAQAGSQLPVPSIHPETPSSQGTYYINKPIIPSLDIQVPVAGSLPSFSGQIPCSDNTCGSEKPSGSLSGAYAGSQSAASAGSQNPNFVYVDKDKGVSHQNINHDNAHLSGGIVFDNGDGSYHHVPTTSKPTYKNAEKGGYAVSSDDAENTGFVIGPGTGHLPIETDAKPFGTQGAFGGSAAFTKEATEKKDTVQRASETLVTVGGDKDYKPFGTQGAYGGSAAFAKEEEQNKNSVQGASGTLITVGGDNDYKPFGTQGAYGGSAAFAKAEAQKKNGVHGASGTLITNGGDNDYKPFGTQGAYGGSASFAKGSASAHSSGNKLIGTSPCTLGDCSSSSAGNTNGFATGDVTIQKIDGTLVSPVDDESSKPGCSSGACSSGLGFGSGSTYEQDTTNKDKDSLQKLECSGESCGDTEVYIIEEKPSKYGSQDGYTGLGCSLGLCGGSGSGIGSGNGFATGQVLVNKGNGATYDVTNLGASGGSYSGANAGSYSGNHFSSSGCSTGRCSGAGIGAGGSFGSSNSGGGLLNKLFGPEGLSGSINKFAGNGFAGNGYAGNGFGGSAAYSNAGSYSSASSGGFASAGASAHAGSFAHSF